MNYYTQFKNYNKLSPSDRIQNVKTIIDIFNNLFSNKADKISRLKIFKKCYKYYETNGKVLWYYYVTNETYIKIIMDIVNKRVEISDIGFLNKISSNKISKKKKITLNMKIAEPSLIEGFYKCIECNSKLGDRRNCCKTNINIKNHIYSFDYICKQCKGDPIDSQEKFDKPKYENNIGHIILIQKQFKKYVKRINEYDQSAELNMKAASKIKKFKNYENVIIVDRHKNKKERIFIDTDNIIYNNTFSEIGIMREIHISIIKNKNNIYINKDGNLLNPITKNILYEYIINDKLSNLLDKDDDIKTYCEYVYSNNDGLILTNEIIYCTND